MKLPLTLLLAAEWLLIQSMLTPREQNNSILCEFSVYPFPKYF